MKFEFVPINIMHLNEIITWTYDGHEKSIYCQPYFDCIEKGLKLRGPGGCIGYAVLLNKKLCGIFEYNFIDDLIEIGLALIPDMVGKGFGREFVLQGVEFGVKEFNYKNSYIQLHVHIDNVSAIRVYEAVGFKVYKQDNNEVEMRFYLKNNG